MVSWPEALVREIADRRALVFIGAGFSKAAKGDMPTWPELLIQLSTMLKTKHDQKLVKALIGKDRLLDAAQIITDGVLDADLSQRLRDVFCIRPTPAAPIFQHLIQLDFKTVVTTNYDEFLERNFDRYSGDVTAYQVATYDSKTLLDKIRSPQRTIVKMHGCITEPSKLVLDRKSYFEARQSAAGFFNVMTALFTTHTILFLGYSIGDPDLQIILENINAASSSKHGHYALLPKLEHRSMATAIKHSFNINCIEYPAGLHRKIPCYLEELENLVTASRASRGIA